MIDNDVIFKMFKSKTIPKPVWDKNKVLINIDFPEGLHQMRMGSLYDSILKEELKRLNYMKYYRFCSGQIFRYGNRRDDYNEMLSFKDDLMQRISGSLRYSGWLNGDTEKAKIVIDHIYNSVNYPLPKGEGAS